MDVMLEVRRRGRPACDDDRTCDASYPNTEAGPCSLISLTFANTAFSIHGTLITFWKTTHANGYRVNLVCYPKHLADHSCLS